MSVEGTRNRFGARDTFKTTSGRDYYIYRLSKLQKDGLAAVDRLPFSIKVLLESVLREENGYEVTQDDVVNLAKWNAKHPVQVELPFKPARVILQDFTGVACVVDLAAMRDAMAKLGGNLQRIQPLIPVDLVIDHSVQVDLFGSGDALALNATI